MSKLTETRPSRDVKRSLLLGCVCTAVFALLLFLASMLEAKLAFLQNGGFPTARLCLTLSALLCGLLCSKGHHTGKLPLALTGESVLWLAVTAIVLAANGDIFTLSYLLDMVCLLFGAFAGALASGRGGKRSKSRR